MAIIFDLGRNIALFSALILIYTLFIPHLTKLSPRLRALSTGIIFGIFALIAMSQPVLLTENLRLDGRTIIVSIATLIGGIIPGSIAGILALAYRVSGGGVGSAAVGSIVTAVVMASLVRHFAPRRARALDPRTLLLLGTIEAGQMVLWLFIEPSFRSSATAHYFVIPMILFVLGGILLVGLVLRYLKRQIQVADELRDSEERYRLVIGAMAEAVVVRYADVPGTILNDAAQRMFGAVSGHVGEIQTLPPGWEIVNEDGSPGSLDQLPSRVALRTGQPQFDVVFGLKRPDNSTTWFSANAQPIFRTGSKKPYGAVSITTDIAQERLAREQLAQERNQLRALIDNITDYIFIKDADGRYVVSNAAHARAANSTPEQMVGKTTAEVFPPEIAQGFIEHDRAVMEGCVPIVNIEQPSLNADGQIITVLTTKIPLKDQTGKCVGLVGISRDITERIRLEQQSHQLDAERERAELLQQFMTDVTHDFKTPLTIINTSIYLLQKTDDPVRQQEQIDKLETQITRLTRLFDDFVTMTNLDFDAYPEDMQPQNINQLVENVIENRLGTAHQKHHTLSFEQGADIPSIYGSSIMLRRAIDCILTNALNYTPDSGVITVRTYPQGDHVIVEVQDNGIGIAQNDLPHIFERLYRVDQARSTATGNTGLGLSIAQKIVEAHKGRITVTSIPGQGSTFQVHLPCNTYPTTDG